MSYNHNQTRVQLFMERIPSQVNMPTKPTIPSLEVRILRARLMLEECLETIENGLGLSIWVDEDFIISMKDLTFHERITGAQIREPNLVEIADGLADQEVVNLGTAIACVLNMQPFFDEVMNNNFLKLERGTIDKYGKLIKSGDHPKPNIERILKEQLK